MTAKGCGWAPPPDEYSEQGYRLAHNRLKDDSEFSLRLARRLFKDRLAQLNDRTAPWSPDTQTRCWEIEGALRAIADLLAASKESQP